MKTTTILLTLAGLALANSAMASEVRMASITPYADDNKISSRIIDECTDLGATLANATQKAAEQYPDLKISLTSENPANDGLYADVKIISATSAGSAFIGHYKGVTTQVNLYRGHTSLGGTTLTRHSTGGMFGGFKSSCSVLNRTANTLGKDIASWINEQLSTEASAASEAK